MRLALACVLLAGCGSSPVPMPVKRPDPPPPPPPPPAPARWVRVGDTNAGVQLGRERLVLLDGARVLVREDGTFERAAGDDGLEALERVPTAASDAPVVVGVSGRALYRFDRPTGPGRRLVVLPERPKALSTWPDRLLLRVGGRTVWLDLEGRAVAPPSLPLQPDHAAFVDARVGLASFPSAGLAVTSDGGATWALVEHAPTHDFHARDGYLALAGGAITESGGPTRPPRPARAPLTAWIEQTGISPLEAAARAGVAAGPGRAVVAGGVWLAEVELATGLPARLSSFEERLLNDDGRVPLWSAASRARGGGRVASFFATSTDGNASPLLEVDLQRPGEAKVIRREANRHGAPVASTSGGLLLRGPCQGAPDAASEDRELCVRQPDGSFATRRTRLDDVAPLASGGLVGTLDGELAVQEGDGAPRKLGALGEPGWRSVSLLQPPDEVAPGSFAALVALAGGPGDAAFPMILQGRAVVALHQGGRLERVTARQDGDFVGLVGAAGRFVSWDEKALRVSVDGGRTWAAAPAPPGTSPYDRLDVGEVGFARGRAARIGWGPNDTAPGALEPADPGPATLPEAALPRRWSVQCEAKGAARKDAPSYLPDEAGARPALEPPPRKGYQRRSDVMYANGLKTQGLVVLDRPAPENKAGKPVMSFHWIDQSEVGAKVRSATGPLPDGFGETGNLLVRFVLGSGDRAVFVVSAGGRWLLGRVSAGKLETQPFPQTRPPKDGALGADGSFAWVGEDGVGVWLAKDKEPRTIAKTRPGHYAIGAPTKDGVPLTVGERGWAAWRAVPSAAGSAWLDVKGWKAAPLVPGALDTLPICAAKAPARGQEPSRLVYASTHVDVRWGEGKPRTTSVVVRADEKGACVEGLVAIWPDRLARLDLARKKAEGGPYGAKVAVQPLACDVRGP